MFQQINSDLFVRGVFLSGRHTWPGDEEKEDEGGTTDTASQSTNSISASVTSDTSTGGMGVTDPSSPSSPGNRCCPGVILLSPAW